MRTSVILNLKGGVAKTATAVNMAAILAKEHNKRVLLVDADSQCNATEFFGGDPVKGSLADALRLDGDGGPFAAACVQTSNFPGVDLLCGSEDLMDLDLTKVELHSVRATVLREMVQRPAVRDHYDYCIVDCPPAFNAASAAALIAADDVVIPIKLDAFALRGMGNLMRQIANMRKINPSLCLSGCLPTMWYNSPQIVEAEKTLGASGLPMYSHIRRTNKVDAMTFAQEPLLITSPRSAAGIDYREFVREYMERGN